MATDRNSGAVNRINSGERGGVKSSAERDDHKETSSEQDEEAIDSFLKAVLRTPPDKLTPVEEVKKK